MKDRIEYSFTLDAYTPDTLPMARLAEYLADLATLLGERGEVHFVRLDPGSTVLVADVEREADPKVQKRLDAIRVHEGPQDALEAFERLDDRLVDDNASASLTTQGVRVLVFPGRERPAQVKYGPFSEPGTLVGHVIMIGGKRDPVPVHIEDGSRTWIASASRQLARKLATHLFGTAIRATGVGRWMRDRDGHWTQTGFIISDFDVLDDASLVETVSRLRGIEANWKALDDPLGDLERLRSGDET